MPPLVTVIKTHLQPKTEITAVTIVDKMQLEPAQRIVSNHHLCGIANSPHPFKNTDPSSNPNPGNTRLVKLLGLMSNWR